MIVVIVIWVKRILIIKYPKEDVLKNLDPLEERVSYLKTGRWIINPLNLPDLLL